MQRHSFQKSARKSARWLRLITWRMRWLQKQQKPVSERLHAEGCLGEKGFYGGRTDAPRSSRSTHQSHSGPKCSNKDGGWTAPVSLCYPPPPRCSTWPHHLRVSSPPSKLSIWHSSHAFMAQLVQAILVFYAIWHAAGQNQDSQWAPTAAAETIWSTAQPHCGYLLTEWRQQGLAASCFCSNIFLAHRDFWCMCATSV